MSDYQDIKSIVQKFFDDMESSTPETVADILKKYTGEDYLWRGVHPFREMQGIQNVAEKFWIPLMQSLTRMQRRQDIFIAGTNEVGQEKWVMSMGNFMGLFDKDFLGIRATGKMVNLRYAEFNCVHEGKIIKTGLFVDIIGLMAQAGAYPLPPSTGVYFNYPGPRHHNGLLFEDAPEKESIKTLTLVNKMIDHLNILNDRGSVGSPSILEKTWSKDMIWYGPAGVGATYTIPRYQLQHQMPFRNNLGDKKFNGHVCRFAEGNFACFFGWPNLTNTPLGGWLGLPGSKTPVDMQVVDVYSREGDKLSENWVLIDIPYWLKQQGLDILDRNRHILNPDLSE